MSFSDNGGISLTSSLVDGSLQSFQNLLSSIQSGLTETALRSPHNLNDLVGMLHAHISQCHRLAQILETPDYLLQPQSHALNFTVDPRELLLPPYDESGHTQDNPLKGPYSSETAPNDDHTGNSTASFEELSRESSTGLDDEADPCMQENDVPRLEDRATVPEEVYDEEPTEAPTSSYVRPTRKVGKRTNRKRLKAMSVIQGELIPRNIVQPGVVYKALLRESQGNDESTAGSLTRFFYAVGCPAALLELRNAFFTVGGGQVTKIPRNSNVAQTVTALQSLEATDCTTRILRRFYLARLCALRNERVRFIATERSHVTTSNILKGRSRRAASIALDSLVQTAYPNLEIEQPDFREKRSWLENRLRRGRNWYTLSEEFSSSILALLPNLGPFAISDTDIEKVPESTFDKFIKLMQTRRGHFLRALCGALPENLMSLVQEQTAELQLAFVQLDSSIDQKQLFDSPRLLTMFKNRREGEALGVAQK